MIERNVPSKEVKKYNENRPELCVGVNRQDSVRCSSRQSIKQ